MNVSPAFIDAIEFRFLAIVLVVSVVLIGTLLLIPRLRVPPGERDPRRRQARGTPQAIAPQRDATYMPPPHLASDEKLAAQDGARPSKPPRLVLHCPRCNQAVLRDERLAEGRVECPVCGCKFYLPRREFDET
jgi:hypothetical protein